MKQQLREIWEFLKNPSRFLVKKSVFPAGKGLLYAYANEIVLLSCYVLLYVVLSIVKKIVGFDLWEGLPEQSKPNAGFKEQVFLLLIWAPLFEEILFRGFLNLKNEYVWVSALFLIFGIRRLFYPMPPEIESVSYQILYLLICVVAGVSLSRIFRKATGRFIERFLRPNFNFLAYASIVGFGFVHVLNFETEHTWQYLLAPLLTLPQVVSGVFLCFIRVNYGLAFSIALHSLDNLFTIIPRLPSEFDKPYLALPIFVVIAYLVRKLWKQSNNQILVEGDEEIKRDAG